MILDKIMYLKASSIYLETLSAFFVDKGIVPKTVIDSRL